MMKRINQSRQKGGQYGNLDSKALTAGRWLNVLVPC